MAKLELSATPRPDHAHYCAHWYRLLGSDPRAIFSAAAKAQEVVDFLEREHEQHQADKDHLQVQGSAAWALGPPNSSNRLVQPEDLAVPFFQLPQETSNSERGNLMSTQTSNTNTEALDHTTPEPDKAPLYDLKLGKLQGSIFRNQTERGDYYSVSIFRTFTGRDGLEKASYSIREQDIPTALEILKEAQKCILAERERPENQTQENQIQVTRNH
jgi:hypothetical protein